MTSPSQTHWDPAVAHTAGALYLAIAICGGLSIRYVPMQIVATDGATSSANLLANQGLFNLGVFVGLLTRSGRRSSQINHAASVAA